VKEGLGVDAAPRRGGSRACDLVAMWRGGDGRLLTVALPEPREVFTDAALAAIDMC